MLYETSIYATTSKLALQPIPSQTTANSNNGGIRYDHDFTPRVFGFGAADFFNNALQDLDLRYILGGGIGLHAIKTPNTTLDLLAGINYTHESFSGLVQTNPAPPPATITYNHSDGSPALTVGDNFTHKLGKNSVFTQSFFLYPSFGQTNIAFPGATPDNVHIMRGAFNLGLVTKLHKWLGWQVTLADVFDNHPLASTPLLEKKRHHVGHRSEHFVHALSCNVGTTHEVERETKKGRLGEAGIPARLNARFHQAGVILWRSGREQLFRSLRLKRTGFT